MEDRKLALDTPTFIWKLKFSFICAAKGKATAIARSRLLLFAI
jgi:hypothetical protein